MIVRPSCLFKPHIIPATILILLSLTCSASVIAQQSKNHPFNGMSAIDIAVAASDKRQLSSTATQTRSATAEAVSAVELYAFDIVELSGRFLHEGWFPIPGDPLPGAANVQAELIGPWQTAQFRLLNEADELIENISLSIPEEAGNAMTLLGTMEVPNQPFKVAVSGIDTGGAAFDITHPEVFRPQTVEVRFESVFSLVNAGVTPLVLNITNHGPLDTFQIFVEDDMGVGVTSDHAEFELGQGETAIARVNLQVPSISLGVLDITVTATATGVSNPSSSNHGTTLARVQKFNLLMNSGFEEGQPADTEGNP